MTLYVISLVLLAASLQTSSIYLDHKIENFGDSILTIRSNLEGKCDELSERELSILLDVVKNS